MHEERFALGEETVRAVNEAKRSGARVFAAGTTTVRVLESVAARNAGKLNVHKGKTNIFIFPPYEFKIVDALRDEFSFAVLDVVDAGVGVCVAGRNSRARNDAGRLCGSDS